MPQGISLFELVEAFALPLIGMASLASSKLLDGAAARAAERWFLGVLLAVTVITCRTVIVSADSWLMHTATLSMMFVGALLLPDRRALAERRLPASTRMMI